jgi:GNAT superfamily N-acetyltransferase
LAFAYMDGRIDLPSSLHKFSPSDIVEHAKLHEVWAIGIPTQACVFLTQKDRLPYLGKLAAHPDHPGNGHASRLFDLAATRARALGYDTLELITRI